VVSLIATLRVKQGKMDEVLDLLKEIVPTVRESESGCLAYIPHIVKGSKNKNMIIFYEKYEDQAAFDVHSANFPSYFENISPLLDGEMDIKICEEII
jgi:quinol monooxygenase YgiN